jgi:HTH-type transcriptional regulator/antitoxin HigA
MINTDTKKIEKIWPKVSEFLGVPHSEKEYKNLVKILSELIDEIGNNENHPSSSLMETIGLLISQYEEKKYNIKDAKGIDVLKYLMEEHGLKQSDLIELGSQGVVSEILNGKRELNIRQIKALAKKFSVSPSVFI